MLINYRIRVAPPLGAYIKWSGVGVPALYIGAPALINLAY
jgi:hypothetical protein